MSKDKKQHYHLVCGTLMLAVGVDISQVTLNAIVTHSTRNLDAAFLGRAQQALQANFLHQMGDGTDLPQIVDVVIISLSYLGHTTDSTFKKAPEGTQMVVREKSIPAPDTGPNPYRDLPLPSASD